MVTNEPPTPSERNHAMPDAASQPVEHRPAPGGAPSPAERRAQIVALLTAAPHGRTGGELAQRLGVSRQIIVQDVAVLRAAGEEILATPQGYVLAPHRRVVACRHNRAQVEDELLALVDAGATVVDVIVEHQLYGEIRAPLWLRSRTDVANFMRQLDRTNANLLSSLTNGVHLHTLEAAQSETLDAALAALAQRGYLLTE
jgi:transcriptional regulator of NAD metabolism